MTPTHWDDLQRDLTESAHELDQEAHDVHAADPEEAAYRAGVAAGKGYAAMKIRAIMREQGYYMREP